MVEYVENEDLNINLIDKIENDHKDKINQTRNKFNYNLDNFLNKCTNSTTTTYDYQSDKWFRSFIEFIKSKYDNSITTKYRLSHVNTENMFRVVIQLELDNVYITYNMFLSKSNYVNEFINQIWNYSCTILEIEDTKEFFKSIDDTTIVDLKNHKNIIQYIIKRDFITVKEILDINNYNLDDKMVYSLNNYISEHIEHNRTIITPDKYEHKIYNWEFAGTINELVKNFCNDINFEFKSNNSKKRFFQNT